LRQELQEAKVDTIHVCTVMPTTFDTPFFEYAGQYAGRPAHPLPPAYDARDVVETIVGLVDNPRDEVSVGSAAKVSIIAHQLFPGLVESFMARETHKAEIENAEPQETGGTLPQPMGMGEGKGDWKR
jgi:short-subunit dehydrogenase